MAFRPFPSAFAALVLLSLPVLFAAPAHAQVGPVGPAVVELALPTEVPRVGVAPASTVIPVAWAVRFDDPALASAALADGQARLDWRLACPDQVALDQPASTPVPLQPGQSGSSGTAELRFTAAHEAVGMEGISCVLEATFQDSQGLRGGTGQAPAVLVVDYVGVLAVATPEPTKAAGPQKLIPYPIDLRNEGNSRIRVTFEAVEWPSGRWNAILPESVLLEPGASATATFSVATPFHNGYNSAGADFRLRVLSSADADRSLVDEPQEVTVRATSEGWYVPGPSPLLALAALGLAGALLRRRAQRP